MQNTHGQACEYVYQHFFEPFKLNTREYIRIQPFKDTLLRDTSDGLPDWALTLRERLALSAAFGCGDVFVEAKAAGSGADAGAGADIFPLVYFCGLSLVCGLDPKLDWTEHVSHSK